VATVQSIFMRASQGGAGAVGEGEENMMSSKALNICGLLCNLAGVVLLFLFGMPFRIATGGKLLTLETNVINEQVRRVDLLYSVLGWIGFVAIVVGTLLQVRATLRQD
jgi:hypothetical protein